MMWSIFLFFIDQRFTNTLLLFKHLRRHAHVLIYYNEYE